MELKEKNKKLFIVVGVLLLFGGISLAYFVTKILTNGNGGSTTVTTAVIKGATVNVEGILSFEDLDILPGHESVSGIKVTATGNNELIPYNLIWKGTNTLTTPLNFTIYKTSEPINVSATCEKKSKMVGSSKQINEECTISNLERLGSEIASGRINKSDTKVILTKDEFITASPTGQISYYYVILEYPNLDEPQNYDLEGAIEGEVTVEESNIKPDINILAAYVVQDDGTYKEVDDIPQSGYLLNSEKSTCSNGAKIRWDYNNKELITSNLIKSGTSCYLYFDKATKASETILAGITVNETSSNFPNVATTDEGVFKVEDGMYGGISYYWRGIVTNNYVMFANFCWRIIRINGDGSIRMIYDGSTCHANGTNTAESIAKTNVTYNSVYDNSSYVGWTYEVGSQRPTSTIVGTVSNAKMQIESWYSSNITGTNAEKVADGKFCNDRNTQNNETWRATGSTQYYAGYQRAYSTYQPTLSCDARDIYTLKVGLITSDEVMFAGGKGETDNNQYYLYNGQYYWTMSPFNWNGNAYVLFVDSNGNLNASRSNVTTPLGLRPVINLKSNITISSGDGTLNNPYVVE